MCRTVYFDCLPGEECLDGHCVGAAEVRVRVASHAGAQLNVVLLAVPPDGAPTSLRRARTLARRAVRATLPTEEFVFDGVPRLSYSLLAWEGRTSGPCRGSSFFFGAVSELPDGTSIALFQRWAGECAAIPWNLQYWDRQRFSPTRARGVTFD